MNFLVELWNTTGFDDLTWQMVVMWFVVAALLYLAVGKGFRTASSRPDRLRCPSCEPSHRGDRRGHEDVPSRLSGRRCRRALLLLLPGDSSSDLSPHHFSRRVGALTDFGPLIANPRTLILGAAAQFGVFATVLARPLLGFTVPEAAAIGIIGGADGPTSIFLANKLAPELLGPIAVAAYSYMALVPLIQPPIMRASHHRGGAQNPHAIASQGEQDREDGLRCHGDGGSCILLVFPASPLIFMLFLGNFFRECGVVERLSKAAQNEIINIVTIFLGISVGITMSGERSSMSARWASSSWAYSLSASATAAGVMAKLMNSLSKHPDQPAHRFRRGERRAHGGPRQPDRRRRNADPATSSSCTRWDRTSPASSAPPSSPVTSSPRSEAEPGRRPLLSPKPRAPEGGGVFSFSCHPSGGDPAAIAHSR
jgi:carboxybiotin decarboxylase